MRTPRLITFALALGSLLAGCAQPGAPAATLVPAGQSLEARSLAIATGNEVQLLQDGPAIFDAIEAAIRGARRSVQVHAYQLGGETGLRIVRALAERHAAGVQVQVIVDPAHGAIGSVKAQVMRCLAALDQAGIPRRDFNLRAMPKGPTWLSRLGVIDHAKLVVVDGEVAIVGGMNFYDDGAQNHDYMVRIAGPAATRLGRAMNLDWRHSGSAEGDLELAEAAPRGDATVTLAETSPRERTIRTLLTERFLAARQKIWVEVLFMDDDKVVEALVKARGRGVDVRVILDPIDWGNHVPELDRLPFNGIPNWAAVAKLLAAEVPVHWYVKRSEHENLHAKIAMVDDRWVLTGSANYTYRSLDRSRELAVEVEAPQVAAAFATVFEADQARARRITALTGWQRWLASLFDLVKRGVYREDKLLTPPPGVSPPAAPALRGAA